MNRNNLLISGTIISLGYIIYKYIQQSNSYKLLDEKYKLQIANLISKLEFETNSKQDFEKKCDELQQDFEKKCDEIQQTVKRDNKLEEKEEEDYSYLSSYMKLEDYLKDMNIIPNKKLFDLLSEDNMYLYLENKKWYTKNDDNTFSECSITIDNEVIDSQKLTKKIDKLKTIQANQHILSLWKNLSD